MECVLFGKLMTSMSVADMGRKTKELGFDGIDLPVRPGSQVLPENVRTDLPEAARILSDMGLSVPMVVSAITSAQSPYAEDVVATCAEVGCRIIRTGSWSYQVADYWSLVNQARRDLKSLEKLAEKYDVCVMPQQHSGVCLNSSCAATYLLVQDCDPRFMGIQADPGHIAIHGEDYRMGLDLMRKYVKSVNVKSPRYHATADRQTRQFRWQVRWVPLLEGLVPWRDVLQAFKDFGFSGPFSFHAEYTGGSIDDHIKMVEEDLIYFRNVACEIGF